MPAPDDVKRWHEHESQEHRGHDTHDHGCHEPFGERPDPCFQVCIDIRQQYVLQVRPARPAPGDLLLVEPLRPHQDGGITPAQTLIDRFRAKGGKQGAENAHVLQGVQRGDVEGDARPG
jgi:hypothetical protein